MAGAPLDEIQAAGFAAAKVPVLMMSGSLNPVGDDAVSRGCRRPRRSTSPGSTWMAAATSSPTASATACSATPGCCAPDEEGFSLVNPWVVAYARYHVLADRGDQVTGLVERTTSISPKVHVQHEGAGK